MHLSNIKIPQKILDKKTTVIKTGIFSAIDSINLWQSLLGFNLGVELGQVLIGIIVFPILWWITKYSEKYSNYLKLTILLPCILIASIWATERTIIFFKFIF